MFNRRKNKIAQLEIIIDALEAAVTRLWKTEDKHSKILLAIALREDGSRILMELKDELDEFGELI